jgi:C-terminal processing protease CtpA/Prc
MSRFRPLSGAADDPFGLEDLSFKFRRFCWAFEGWGESFEVAFVGPSGGDGSATLRGVSAEEYARLKKQAVVMDAEPYSFSITPDGFGLIEFRSCIEPERMLKFIDEVFARLKHESIPGLVIDARDNTGGGDDVWRPLVQHFADKPFSAYAGSRFRVSQRIKDKKGREEFINGYGDRAWETPAGTWIDYRTEPDDLTPPSDSPLRYTGPVCVLAGPRTFSSGMSFIAAVKAYGLGTVIGQETGGRVKGFGQWVEFALPRTKMTIAVSTKEFIGAVDVPYRRGVPPDIAVGDDPAALRYSAGDAAYQEAVRVLRAKSGRAAPE